MTKPSKPDGGNIMIVDDTPANLTLLEGMLVQQGYEIRSFPLGRLALAAAEHEPPDLILLDVNMPEMNGYEVCERLKSRPALADIPVIFVSALNDTDDKVAGFHAGGADYVSKPFELQEVQARVETHLKLRRAQRAERELLERTLAGAVGAFWELIQISSPLLVLRTHSIRDIVLHLAAQMEPVDAWQYELAGMLCLVGCVVLPTELFERAYGGQDLSSEEDQIFRAHPEVAASLLSKIPRLEAVAEMVRRQHAGDADLASTEPSKRGALMLHLALELDRKIFQGIDCHAAIATLKTTGKLSGPMLDALDGYSPTHAAFEVRQLLVRELRPEMVLDEDVLTAGTKLLILNRGMVLNPVWIDRLANFARARGVQERLRVRVPKLPGLELLPALGNGGSGVGVHQGKRH